MANPDQEKNIAKAMQGIADDRPGIARL